MDGFIFFAIIVFVVIPMIKNATKTKRGKKSTSKPRAGQKNWSQVQMKTQNKNTSGYQYDKQRALRSRDAHGHTTARKNAHKRLHVRDGNTDVFPKSHITRVRKRDQRDRFKRNRIETIIHSKKNTSLVRESNKGVDNWGERGDASGSNNLLWLILLGLIAFFLILKLAPELWFEIMRILNIR